MLKRIFFIFILFTSCTQTKNDMAYPTDFDWQGHRGCRGILPENSIPAFLKALEYPVKTLELDLAVSKDNKLIVSHEPFFSHHICKKPDGTDITEEEAENLRIIDYSYQEIKAFDCGSRGNERFPDQKTKVVYKPSFEDVVNAVEIYCQHNNREKPYYNIEIKSQEEWYGKLVPSPADFVALVVKEVTDLGIQDRVCIQSFDTSVMLELNKQAPKITNAYLIENRDSFEDNLAKLDFVPDIYSPYFLLVNEQLIKSVRKKNMQLIPWTVNEVEQMRNLIDMGVDGIITDYPNRILLLKKDKVKD